MIPVAAAHITGEQALDGLPRWSPQIDWLATNGTTIIAKAVTSGHAAAWETGSSRPSSARASRTPQSAARLGDALVAIVTELEP